MFSSLFPFFFVIALLGNESRENFGLFLYCGALSGLVGRSQPARTTHTTRASLNMWGYSCVLYPPSISPVYIRLVDTFPFLWFVFPVGWFFVRGSSRLVGPIKRWGGSKKFGVVGVKPECRSERSACERARSTG